MDGKNGAALINVDSFLPPSMTLCMRGRILYNRHGDINYWFNVLIKRKNPTIFSPTIDFGFYQKSKGEWILEGGAGASFVYIIMNEEEQDKAKEANSWPSRNTLRKWTHACVVGDFTDDKTTLFINGKKINEAEFKFSKSFPENYFSEELRSSGEIMSGFSVEFGRHAFDSAPIIGDLVDINAWDRALDESELEAITNCRSFELRVGNLINKTSAFNLTGPLCQPVEVEKKELSCRETKDILLPVHANSLSNAVKQCNRLLQKVSARSSEPQTNMLHFTKGWNFFPRQRDSRTCVGLEEEFLSGCLTKKYLAKQPGIISPMARRLYGTQQSMLERNQAPI